MFDKLRFRGADQSLNQRGYSLTIASSSQMLYLASASMRCGGSSGKAKRTIHMQFTSRSLVASSMIVKAMVDDRDRLPQIPTA